MANGLPATPKEQILEALKDLPADATFDDAIERLVFLAKSTKGLRSSTRGNRSRMRM
jgi:hypothetical protein